MNPSIKKLTLVCGEFVSVSVFSKAKYHVPFFYELFFLILTHDNILNHKKSVIILGMRAVHYIAQYMAGGLFISRFKR